MRNFLILCVFFFAFAFSEAQTIEKTYIFNEISISKIDAYDVVNFNNTKLTGPAGEPALPYHSVSLLLPPGQIAESIEIIGVGKVDLKGSFNIYPQQHSRPLSEGASGKFVKKDEIYNSDNTYPLNMAGELSTEFMNGYSFAFSAITPVQYNPASGKLSYFKKIIVKIKTKNNSSAVDALQNISSAKNILKRIKSLSQNPEALIQYPDKGYDYDTYQMLIITKAQFENSFQDLIDLYIPRGITTQIETVENIYSSMPGQDNPEKIRNFIIQEYQSSGVEYVMLGGDVEIVPYRGFYCTVASSSTYEDDNIPADLYYSALDGTWNDDGDNLWGEIGEDDLLPDVSVARFSFSNTTELNSMMNKSVSYQSNPVLGELRQPLLAGEHLYGDPITWGADYLELHIGYHEDNGYTTDGIPEDYDYITMFARDQSWGGSDMINMINSGVSFVNHVGHANTNTVMNLSTSDITNSNFSQTNGVDHNYTTIYTHGCICGSFDASDCIGEEMVKIDNMANAFVGNSRYGWFNEGQTEGPSQHMHREFTDAMYHDKLSHIGTAHMVSKIETAPWVNAPGQWEEGALRWCFYDCNVLGDPAMMVWTDEPVSIDVQYEQVILMGVQNYQAEVSSNGSSLENMSCVLMKEGIVYGIGKTDEYGIANIAIDPIFPAPGEAQLIVSGYNCFPETFDLTVIPGGIFVAYTSHEINDITGNANGLADYGEAIQLSLEIMNYGTENTENIEVTLSSSDEFVTITDDTENYGIIPAGEAVSIENGFAVEIANNIPDQHEILFIVSATDGNEVWESNFEITAYSPILKMNEFIISGDGRIDPGETVDIMISIQNNGSSEAYNILGELSVNTSYITINTSSQNYGDVLGGEMMEKSFSVTASSSTPTGYFAEFDFDITADLGIAAFGEFNLIIGQVPVLVLDLDENTSSGPEMKNSLDNLGVGYEYVTSIPNDLELYSSIFVCLGIYSDNHVLSSDEGQALAAFLINGGKIYMEGGDTWYYDDQTAVHSMFNIDGESDGSSDLGTINGQSGTFTEDMNFSYSGDNSWIDHIGANSPAVVIFENQSPNYGCGVAYDEGNYKTIGTSFEFGGLDDGSFTKDNLMEKYLDFFGLLPSGGITQNINLNQGYQFVSSRVEVENPDMLIVLQNILNENLEFVRNSEGTILRKIGPNWVNGIGNWIGSEGYLFKMNDTETLEMNGEEIDPLTPISLYTGYQFISYFPAESIDAMIAFENIINDNLDYIRNSNGSMLRKIGPNWVNGIGNANPTEGYLVKMYSNDELIYNIPSEKALSNINYSKPEHFTFNGGNAADPVYTIYFNGLEIGDEIAAFDGNVLVGALAINSDDIYSNALPIFSTINSGHGYSAGNKMSFKLWDESEKKYYSAQVNFSNPYGDAYTENIFPENDGEYSIANVKTTENSLGLSQAYLGNVYPNPVSENAEIEFGLTENSNVELNIYNLLGEKVITLVNKDMTSGVHKIKFNCSDLKQGIYQYKIVISSANENFVKTKKMIISH